MHDNGEDTSCCLSERVHVFRDGLDPETQDIKWLKVCKLYIISSMYGCS